MIRNRIICVLLLIFNIILIYFYGGVVPYAMLYTVILLPVLSLVLFIISFKSTTLSFDIKALRIVQGDAFSLEISLNNTSLVILPFIKLKLYTDKKIFAKKSSAIHLSAMPLQNQNISVDIFCEYRGKFEVSVQTIAYYDFLCLYKKTSSFKSKPIIVLPKILEISELMLIDGTIFNSDVSKRFKPDDVTEIIGIKEYNVGDSIRFMHWKLSSKKDKLLMKSFAKEQNCCIAIIIDNSDVISDIKLQDTIIEKASSLLYYCYSNEIRCSMYYYDNGIINIDMNSLSDYNVLYEALAEIEFTQTPNLTAYMSEIIYAKNNFENLSILSFDKSLELMQNTSDNLGYSVITMMEGND